MKPRNTIKSIAVLALALLATLVPCLAGAQTVSPQGPIPGAEYFAVQYNYGGFVPGGQAPGPLYIDQGNSSTGSASITVRANANIVLFNGRVFMPLATNAAILVGNGSNQETVTPTAVSCNTPMVPGTCTITATFSNTHGAGERIASATFGLAEAINDANNQGGGTVWVDQAWVEAGGVSTTITGITAATPKVWIADVRGPGPITWYGKSGTGSAAYSGTNNDINFTVTQVAGTITKTLSQTYTVAPVCTGTWTGTGTFTGILKISPTTSTVVVASSVGTDTGQIQTKCSIVK